MNDDSKLQVLGIWMKSQDIAGVINRFTSPSKAYDKVDAETADMFKPENWKE